MYNEIIFTETIKQYYYYLFFGGYFQHFDKEIKSQGIFWGTEKYWEKIFMFFSFLKNSFTERGHSHRPLLDMGGWIWRPGWRSALI